MTNECIYKRSDYINKINNKEFVNLDNNLKSVLREFKNRFLEKYNGHFYKDIIREIKHLLIENNFIIICDVKNAYRSVDRNKLYDIMKKNNSPDYVINFLKSYYESLIINDGATNKYFNIKNGLIIGCPLSPNLFKIYIEHITRKLKNIIIYVDDLVIWDKNYDVIIKSYNDLIKEMELHNLFLNNAKTHFIKKEPYQCFSNKPVNFLKFYLNPKCDNDIIDFMFCLQNYINLIVDRKSKNIHQSIFDKCFRNADLWKDNYLNIYKINNQISKQSILSLYFSLVTDMLWYK